MDNQLLRLKNKKIKDIKITSEIKSVINEWYKKYQKGELKEERRNYLNFENQILKKLLRYKNNDFQFEYPLDGRSVEFMIMKDDKPYIAVELKGTQTKDLTRKQTGERYSAVEQASNYANKKSSIKWYIVSNYYEFRLYNSESQNKYISFTLDDLRPNGYDFDEKRIEQFLTVFSREAVLEKDIISKLYSSEGLFPEDFNLENEFYKLYNQTRLILVKELEETNNISKDEAIEYAQLILNRYIFICFCEDKELLPDNLTSDEILTPIIGKRLAKNTIWNRLNDLFFFIDEGNPEKDITDYNGGLFKEDLSHFKIRDKIDQDDFYNDIKAKWSFPEQEHIIDHELRHYPNINKIYRNLLIISSFDFQTDLTENILGHIFENSISDIEDLKNEKESQRKKEGVYYTPEHITKYICENTIIPYLSNKNNNTVESLIKEYSNNLKELETKLHDIKILDPACGSGAFLNKATDTLLTIHKAIFNTKNTNNDNLDKEFDNIDNRRDILLNNVYGVDLNHESIEITKLGLFLKVCKKGIKLPDLDKNIKCGNSLIEDSEFTDKPFNWETEFPEIFENGGFDIVIGNPPYIKEATNKLAFRGLKNSPYYKGKMDIWYFFGSVGLDIVKNNGIVSFIAPNNWITNYGASLFRNKVNEEATIYDYLNFGNYKVFADAGINTMIYFMKKNHDEEKYEFNYSELLDKNINEDILYKFLFSNEPSDKYFKFKSIHDRVTFKDDYFVFLEKNISNIVEKIKHNNITYLTKNEVATGIDVHQDFLNKKNAEKLETPDQVGIGIFVLSNNEKKELNFNKKELSLIKPYYTTEQLFKYYADDKNKYWLIYTKSDINDKINEYPNIKKHLDKFKNIITSSNKPYGLHRPRKEDIFLKEKIIVARKSEKPNFTFVDFDSYVSQTFNVIKTDRFDLKILSTILNSKLIEFWLKFNGKIQGNLYQLDKEPLLKIPIIREIPENIKKEILQNFDNIKKYNEKYYKEIESFHKYLISDFKVTNINKKLKKYHILSFDELYKEVKKQYKQISRTEKDKLEEEYISSLEIIKPLQKEINDIDKEIDRLAYELYDLTPEEIKIIEKSLE